MTDDIKLPPLPEPVAVIHGIRVWTIESMSNYEAAIKANLQQRGEPVAYAVFSDNGNIRIWCADPIQAEGLRKDYGNQLQSLYAAPQPAAPSLAPSDADILRTWNSFVGDPTDKYPLTESDKIGFARALLARYGSKS